MAGIVLSSQKLAEMNDANFRAMKTAKGQLKEAQALNADLRANLAQLQSQRDTAEAQLARLLDDAETLKRELDAADERADFIANGWAKQIKPYVMEYQKRFGENILPDAAHLLAWMKAERDAARQSRGRLVRAYRKAMNKMRWTDSELREFRGER